MPSALLAQFRRDMLVNLRTPAESAANLALAVLITCLFPLALSPSPETLRQFAPGLVAIAILLSQFLSMERMFRPDLESGALDLAALGPLPLSFYVAAKAAAHWLTHGLPLLLVTPILLLLLNVPGDAVGGFLLSAALGTLCMTLLGAFGAAATLGARQPALLLPLILIPLAVPVLIFTVTLAAEGIMQGAGRQSAFFLGALFFLYLALAPFLSAAALASTVENS